MEPNKLQDGHGFYSYAYKLQRMWYLKNNKNMYVNFRATVLKVSVIVINGKTFLIIMFVKVNSNSYNYIVLYYYLSVNNAWHYYMSDAIKVISFSSFI